MINSFIALSFILISILACHPKQATFQRTSIQDFEQGTVPKPQKELLPKKRINLYEIKNSLYEKIKVDTLDIKSDTLPPSKEKKLTPADTLIPKAANLDSILVQNPNLTIQAKADKLANQAYNLGIISLILTILLGPLGLIAGIIAITLGKKALRQGTNTPKKAKKGILIGKISIVLFFLSILVILLFVIWIINSLSNIN